MKLRQKDCCTGSSPLLDVISMRYLVLLFMLFTWPALAMAHQEQARTQNGSGLIEFTRGEFAITSGTTPPSEGWEQGESPKIYQLLGADWTFGDYNAMAGRFAFQGSTIPDGPVALYLIGTRNQFKVRLNGQEIFRNYAALDDQKLSWNRPHIIRLDPGAIQPGANELLIETVSQEAIGIGRVIIGPADSVQSFYVSQFFWRITAPEIANFSMLLIGVLVFLYWLRRRHETELLFLSLAALVWFVRYYHYFADRVPFDPALFSSLSENANYYGSTFTAAFYLHFLKFRYRREITAGLLCFGLILTTVYYFSVTNFYLFYLPTFIITIGLFVTALINLMRNPDLENGALALAMLLATTFGLTDGYLAYRYGGDGNAIYLSVFTGLIYAVAFILSLGSRAISAFYTSERANALLEKTVAETRAELAHSEASRQQLVVETAIANEHGRLMQEMHDGIGSNLITALAVAREQAMPESMIRTLGKALNDLKITVDSLEPVEGDILALIGNLRHRMAADLKYAGIDCKWDAQSCEPLPWLDATNALHVLRIFQEAIGNVLAHSGADKMKIGCSERECNGQLGIEVYVADNGCGFDPLTGSAGKGLENMKSRARSLQGELKTETGQQGSTKISLWLPYDRDRSQGPKGADS